MTEDEIACVRESFALVRPVADQAAAAFYERLFRVAPQVRPMFKGDMAAQGRKLMATIGMVVASLDDLGGLLPAVEALGRRHVAYGAQPAHYAVVGECLVATLREALGDAFPAETEAAWLSAYATLSGAMVGAMVGAAETV